jgi:hypothetical protein
LSLIIAVKLSVSPFISVSCAHVFLEHILLLSTFIPTIVKSS